MGFSVSKIFIEATDQEKIKKEIQAHVKAVGSQTLTTNEKGASPEKGRHYRTFVLSRVDDGKITIWEDGGTIADLTLAEHLSKVLATKTYWMQLAPPVAYAGYCRYENGELVESKTSEGGGLEDFLQQFAEKYKLPWFWDTYENPNPLVFDASDEAMQDFAKTHGFESIEALKNDPKGMADFLVIQAGKDRPKPKLPEVANSFIAINLEV